MRDQPEQAGDMPGGDDREFVDHKAREAQEP
jgi:hypothetical protein